MRTWMIGLMALAALGLAFGRVGSGADQEQSSETERLLIRAQKICPVSGKPLGSMGDPLKADSDGRMIFLCCKGCMGKSIPAENWSKVTANLRQAQGKCPVLGKPLPANAASVVVEKRTVFVCCKPCIAKIQGDPKKYLAIVDQSLKSNLKD